MQITVIIRDNYSSEFSREPLIYTVDVENPQNAEEVLRAVKLERAKDLSEDYEDPDDIDLDVFFAFPGDLTPIADWRE